jgi:hypothetical protein
MSLQVGGDPNGSAVQLIIETGCAYDDAGADAHARGGGFQTET